MSFSVIKDRRDKYRDGATKALLMRTGHERPDYRNEFVHLSLLEHCRISAELVGINTTGLDKRKLVTAALQPASDFPAILENVATKEALKGYEEAPEVYTSLARIGSLRDFKQSSRASLGAAPSLPVNTELQEVETLELADRKQSIQLATYAGKFGVSRQALINDDLGELQRMGRKLGQGARRTVGDQFANVLTQHVDGQLIDEGSARIFDSARNNTGTAGVPSTATFSEFRALAAKQTDVGGNAQNLNIPLSKILCPVALEGACQIVAASEHEVGGSNDKTTPNVEFGRWEILSDARLDSSGLTKAGTRYYAFADPNLYDTIEVAFLDGIDQPQIHQVDISNPMGVYWVVYIDCVAQALDFRTMAKNEGS